MKTLIAAKDSTGNVYTMPSSTNTHYKGELED